MRDVFLVSEIPGRQVKSGTFSASTVGHWFFGYLRSLYSLSVSSLQHGAASLDQAEKIDIPDGTILNLMALHDTLYLIMGYSNQAVLYQRVDTQWNAI